MYMDDETLLIGFSSEEIEEYNRLKKYMNNSNDDYNYSDLESL